MDRFCSECGSKLLEEQAFCPECGTPRQIIEEKKNEASPIKETIRQPVARKPMSFKKKLSMTLVGMLVIGLISGHQIIKANTSPQEKINTFLAALSEEDTNTVMSEIQIPAKTEKNDQSFMEFLNSQDIEEFRVRMMEAANNVLNDGIARVVKHENGTDVFRIKQEKIIGLYPVIQIEAIPIEVSLTTDFEEGHFEMGNKTVEINQADVKVGSYLPGLYQSEISKENGEIEKIVEFEQAVWGPEDSVIELSSERLAVEIWSNDSEAIVYLDGKSTGKKVKDLKVIGPIKEDDTISLYAERKNKKGVVESSEEVIAAGGEFVELPILSTVDVGETDSDSTEAAEEAEEAEEVEEVSVTESFDKEALTTFIGEFRSAYEESLNSKNFSLVDGYLLDKSIAQIELVDFINDIGNDYYLYEFIQDNIIEVEILDDKAFVTTFEEFDFTNHLDVVTNYQRNKRYEVLLNADGQYQISKIDILDTVREN